VVDIHPLAGLEKLKSLALRDNPIEDVSPLSGLANLKDLNLNNTAITAEQADALRNEMPDCEIVN
jgi:internalin A